MVILASASPRRKELLHKLYPEFQIVVPKVDERLLDAVLTPKDLAAEESKLKAYAVFASHPDDEIIACDTIVVLDGKVLEKPADEEDAKAMLREESGKWQIVLSGYTYLSKEKEITRTVATRVLFHELSDELIEEYVKTKSPLDKAGAYGIQDGFPLVKQIDGSFDNVMGLTTEDMAKHLK